MKKLLLLVVFVVSYSFAVAQNNVTKFMGVSVDGTKAEMVKLLKTKGFNFLPDRDVLMGKYNGEDIILTIQTKNDKVWRVFTCPIASTDESGIKVKFNKLYEQFSNDKKYVLHKGDKISSSEDISKGLDSKKKYEVYFIQKTDGSDKLDEKKLVWFMISRDRSNKYRMITVYDNGYNADK
jgi:hypothetical protein